jgi:hypothetical protein
MQKPASEIAIPDALLDTLHSQQPNLDQLRKGWIADFPCSMENREGSANIVFLRLCSDFRFVGGEFSAAVRVVTEFSTV